MGGICRCIFQPSILSVAPFWAGWPGASAFSMRWAQQGKPCPWGERLAFVQLPGWGLRAIQRGISTPHAPARGASNITITRTSIWLFCMLLNCFKTWGEERHDWLGPQKLSNNYLKKIEKEPMTSRGKYSRDKSRACSKGEGTSSVNINGRCTVEKACTILVDYL